MLLGDIRSTSSVHTLWHQRGQTILAHTDAGLTKNKNKIVINLFNNSLTIYAIVMYRATLLGEYCYEQLFSRQDKGTAQACLYLYQDI